MASITIVSAIILLTIYRPYERGMLRWSDWITANGRNLAVFMAIIFVIPIVLLLL
jgi:hypothetical protein